MGYFDIQKKIQETWTGRSAGSQITPDTHQSMAEALLEYIRDVEDIAESPLIGIADENTKPLQPDKSFCSYLSCVAANTVIQYRHFFNIDGEPIEITSSDGRALFVILYWNKCYWDYKTIPIYVTNYKNIIETSEDGFYLVDTNLNIGRYYKSEDNNNLISVKTIIEKNSSDLIVETNENGFYLVDTNLNIGCYYKLEEDNNLIGTSASSISYEVIGTI